MKGAVFAVPAFFLFVAIIVQAWPRSGGNELAMSRLPFVAMVADDWHGTTLPLESTEALAASAADTLRFDDVLFRQIKTTLGTFTIYAAYWRPGKIPTQLVASHTPDRCWTESGWRCLSQEHSRTLIVGTTTLRPGEERIFEGPHHDIQHVIYWHLVGSSLYAYGDRFNNIPSVWLWWRDAVTYTFRSPPAQCFVRLASNVPFQVLSKDPAFQAVVERLAELGLADRALP